MVKINPTVSRGLVLGATLLISTLALAIWHGNTPTTSAQSGGAFAGAIFSVTPDPGQTFTQGNGATGSSFAVQGTIAFKNARGQTLNDGVGRFYRSGEIVGGVSIVTDVYVLDSFNGAIMAQGVVKGVIVGVIEQADLLAVTGGIGTYRGASGEAQLTTTDPSTGAFTVVLQEARRLDQPGHFVR